MFIGHLAVGFAAKRFAPRTSLALLMAAPTLSDLLWPIFLLLGWEHVRIDPGNTNFTPLDFYDYPLSHSLLMNIIWASLFAGIYYLISRYGPGAIAIWIGVISHWILDFVSHGPDMPLFPGGPKVGLGLWNSVPATIIVEYAMFIVGLWLYIGATRACDRTGRYALVVFVLFTLLIYAGNSAGPPPPNVSVLAWFAVMGWIVIPWCWWIDRHREVVRGKTE
jgi:hypothetical protein